MPVASFSQNPEIERLFSNQKTTPGFSVEIAKKGEDINLGLDGELEKLISNTNRYYKLRYRGSKNGKSALSNFQSELMTLIQSGGYELLTDNIYSGDGLRIYVKRDGNSNPAEVIFIKENEISSKYLYTTK